MDGWVGEMAERGGGESPSSIAKCFCLRIYSMLCACVHRDDAGAFDARASRRVSRRPACRPLVGSVRLRSQQVWGWRRHRHPCPPRESPRCRQRLQPKGSGRAFQRRLVRLRPVRRLPPRSRQRCQPPMMLISWSTMWMIWLPLYKAAGSVWIRLPRRHRAG